MKRRELLWLFLPCFLLAGLAWYFSVTRPGEFRVILEEAKVLPATQWDTANGVSAKVIVKARAIGLPRDAAGRKYHAITNIECVLVSEKTGKPVPFPRHYAGISSSGSSLQGRDITTYYLPVNAIPASYGALTLRLTATSKLMVEEINGSSAYQRIMTSTPQKFSVIVRPSGAPLPLPATNKYRPFKIRGFQNFWRSAPGGSVCRVDVIVNQFAPPLKPEGTSVFHFSGQVIADKQEIGRPNSYGYNFDEKTSVGIANIGSDNVTIPNSARTVTLKGRISINECWPLPFEITLRKDGKNLTSVKPEL